MVFAPPRRLCSPSSTKILVILSIFIHGGLNEVSLKKTAQIPVEKTKEVKGESLRHKIQFSFEETVPFEKLRFQAYRKDKQWSWRRR